MTQIMNANKVYILEWKKQIKILNIQWIMNFKILMIVSITPCKTHEYEFLSCNLLVWCFWNCGILHD
jgi:hypothetical protein